MTLRASVIMWVTLIGYGHGAPSKMELGDIHGGTKNTTSKNRGGL